MQFPASATLLGLITTLSWSISLAQLTLPLSITPSNSSGVNTSVNSVSIDSLLDDFDDVSATDKFMLSGGDLVLQKIQLSDVSATARKRATNEEGRVVAKRALIRRVDDPAGLAGHLFSETYYNTVNGQQQPISALATLAMYFVIRPDQQDSLLDQLRYTNFVRIIARLIRLFSLPQTQGRLFYQQHRVILWNPLGTRSPSFHVRFTYTPTGNPLPVNAIHDIVRQLWGLLQADQLGPFVMRINVGAEPILTIELEEREVPDPSPPDSPRVADPPGPGTGETDRSAYTTYITRSRAADRDRRTQEDNNQVGTQNVDAQNLGLPFVRPAVNRQWRFPLYNKPGHLELR